MKFLGFELVVEPIARLSYWFAIKYLYKFYEFSNTNTCFKQKLLGSSIPVANALPLPMVALVGGGLQT